MRLPVAVFRGAAWLAVPALVSACAFESRVILGSDEEPRAGNSGQSGTAETARGGSAGSRGSSAPGVGGAGGQHPGAAGLPPSPCNVGRQSVDYWTPVTPSTLPLESGEGGNIELGPYRLVSLVEHGFCHCLDLRQRFAQFLILRSGEGTAVIDDAAGRSWGAVFTYTINANRIAFSASCMEDAGRQPAQAPFGPFDTFTAKPGLLRLYSSQCNYEAAYARLPAPPP